METPTLATFIDFSTLAAARSRSSIFLVNDLIYALDLSNQGKTNHMINQQTYLLFSALVLFDYIWVGGEKHLQSLAQCPQLVLQLIRASLVRRARLQCENRLSTNTQVRSSNGTHLFHRFEGVTSLLVNLVKLRLADIQQLLTAFLFLDVNHIGC